MSDRGNGPPQSILGAAWQFLQKNQKILDTIALLAICSLLFFISIQTIVIEVKVHDNGRVANKTHALLKEVGTCLGHVHAQCSGLKETLEQANATVAVAVTAAPPVSVRNRGATAQNSTAG